MSEETKKIDQIEQDAKSAELSEQDLDNVAGGVGKPIKPVNDPRYPIQPPPPQY